MDGIIAGVTILVLMVWWLWTAQNESQRREAKRRHPSNFKSDEF